MKPIVARLKPFLRWLILGATLFFLASALHRHWAEITDIRLDRSSLVLLFLSFGVTLLAHIWTGWVWGLILRSLGQPAIGTWAISTYLQTNIAKYLPGNVWHLYGRVVAAKNAGFPAATATLSVLLEPLLMAAAALLIALLSGLQTYRIFQTIGLVFVLAIVHPRILNPLLATVSRLKNKERSAEVGGAGERRDAQMSTQISHYPLIPLLGELGFVLLRGGGFLLTLRALTPIAPTDILPSLSGFSIAWLLGLVIPGAPGGIGVFEATTTALLSSQFSAAIILGSVALYRLISTLAEAVGAGLAWLAQRWHQGDRRGQGKN
ncbi:MAG TPA: YbhN family protein [Trichocoleus sp.]